MTNPLPDGGATQLPEYAKANVDTCVHEPNNPNSRTGVHSWRWVWENGAMTNRVRCSTCGEERELHK